MENHYFFKSSFSSSFSSGASFSSGSCLRSSAFVLGVFIFDITFQDQSVIALNASKRRRICCCAGRTEKLFGFVQLCCWLG